MKILRLVAAGSLAAAGLFATAPAASADTQLSDQDRTYLAAAHQSNLTEIASGEAAQEQATTDVVREHGELFIADHTRLDESLVPVAEQLGVELPDAPSPAQQATLEKVTAQEGAAFDEAWIAAQIVAHEASLAATEQQISAGTNPEVVALAETAKPVIESHLAMLNDHGSPTSVSAGSGGQAAGSEGGGIVLPLMLLGGAALLAAGSVRFLRRSAA